MKTKVRVKTTARSIYKGEQVHQSILKSMCPFLKILYEIYLGYMYIFQTFWKPDCCTKSLFFELETSNFGYLFIF